ncbi:MAG: YbhB/YbcL family Raf kinase inhibitor-like protein [Candidatus Kaiserbacteria bacterium]|nr:YbhB/YbcL family Raf kinase inhibitor-like protein [Candidatus Kaiserbacteria bacterium]
MEIKTQEFRNEKDIPRVHTCDGSDRVPTIQIRDIPPKTRALALIIDDPDATGGGVWDHCVLYNIPAETKEIHAKNIDTFQSGVNSWGKERYGGPCPPRGDRPHRYYFKLYALDSELEFKKPPNTEQLTKAMKRHILKEASCMGVYSRK